MLAPLEAPPPTRTEVAELERLVGVVRRNLQQAGEALDQIYTGYLYRAWAPTWQRFCAVELGISSGKAWRLIRASRVRQNIGHAAATESHCVELWALHNNLEKWRVREAG